MKSEPLGLEHKELLYEMLKKIGSPISEYSFANLFLFRKVHQYRIIRDREVFIHGVTYDGKPYLMPAVPPGEIAPDYLREMLGTVDFLFPVDEGWLPLFDGDEFECSSMDGDRDYVYTVEKMSTYSGRKLHRKRNLLYHFERGYRHEASPLTAGRMDDARHILDRWQEESGMESSEADYEACREALDLYDELVLCGGIYYAEGEPAGFIIGEELNSETFVLHFAKGVTKFKGVYQYIFNNFAGILPKKYRYLNFEQDLGRENLRVAKSSYYPDTMIRKMRVSLRR